VWTLAGIAAYAGALAGEAIAARAALSPATAARIGGAVLLAAGAAMIGFLFVTRRRRNAAEGNS